MNVIITGVDYEKTFKFNEELSTSTLNEVGTFNLNGGKLTGFDKDLIRYWLYDKNSGVNGTFEYKGKIYESKIE